MLNHFHNMVANLCVSKLTNSMGLDHAPITFYYLIFTYLSIVFYKKKLLFVQNQFIILDN